MSDETLILTLAKVLIAAAWADGEPTHAELNSMKDLLSHLPQLTGRQWASIQMYIDSPVDEAERARLVAELSQAIKSEESRELALQALQDLVCADGTVSEEEAQVVAEIQEAIQSVDVGVSGRLGRVVQRLLSSQASAAAGPNREQFFEDYISNKVYYGLQLRAARGDASLFRDEATLRKLSLAGGLMAQVAHVNPEVAPAEVAAMGAALQEHWQLSPEEAGFVSRVAVEETATSLDRHRLAREFAAVSDYSERVAFLDVLFAVAAADGQASFEEIEAIRSMTIPLQLPTEVFAAAKLKLPPDRREA